MKKNKLVGTYDEESLKALLESLRGDELIHGLIIVNSMIKYAEDKGHKIGAWETIMNEVIRMEDSSEDLFEEPSGFQMCVEHSVVHTRHIVKTPDGKLFRDSKKLQCLSKAVAHYRDYEKRFKETQELITEVEVAKGQDIHTLCTCLSRFPAFEGKLMLWEDIMTELKTLIKDKELNTVATRIEQLNYLSQDTNSTSSWYWRVNGGDLLKEIRCRKDLDYLVV